MITVSWAVAKRCPYVEDEIDVGTVTVTCPVDAPELHGLAARIREIAAAPVTHEDFTRQVAALLPPGSQVAWKTRTAGGDVDTRESA